MVCKYCGTELEECVLFCPECGAQQEAPAVEEVPAQPPVEEAAPRSQAPAKKSRKKPHIALRIPLQLLSFFLCIALLAVSLCAALLLDLNVLLSKNGINQLLDALLTPAAAAAAPAPAPMPRMPSVHLTLLSAESTGPTDGDGLPDSGDDPVIPDGVLDGADTEEATNNLIDFVLALVREKMGGQLPATEEQIQEIVERSSLKEFVAEKIASYTQDVLQGTSETLITTEEVMELVDENKALLEDVFNAPISTQVYQAIEQQVDDMIVKEDLNEVIHENITAIVEDAVQDALPPIGDLGGILGGGDNENTSVLDQYRALLSLLTAKPLLYSAAGVCLVLLLLLCLLNWYNVPAGLTWAALPLMLSGLMLSLPIFALQFMPGLLQSLLGNGALLPVLSILPAFAGVLAPVHYGLLGIGTGLLVISIVWRSLRAYARKKAV